MATAGLPASFALLDQNGYEEGIALPLFIAILPKYCSSKPKEDAI
jgi:hypothetical protein